MHYVLNSFKDKMRISSCIYRTAHARSYPSRVFILSLKKISLSKMAGRTSSAFYYCALAFYLFFLTSYNNGERFGDKPRTLHIVENTDSLHYKKTLIIDKGNDSHEDNGETSYHRTRRNAVPRNPNNNPVINAKVRHCFLLNSSI